MCDVIEFALGHLDKRIHPLSKEIIEVKVGDDKAFHFGTCGVYFGAQTLVDYFVFPKIKPVIMGRLFEKKIAVLFFAIDAVFVCLKPH